MRWPGGKPGREGMMDDECHECGYPLADDEEMVCNACIRLGYWNEYADDHARDCPCYDDKGDLP